MTLVDYVSIATRFLHNLIKSFFNETIDGVARCAHGKKECSVSEIQLVLMYLPIITDYYQSIGIDSSYTCMKFVFQDTLK